MGLSVNLFLQGALLVSTVFAVLPPPYYSSSLTTTFYILPILRYNETELVPMLSEESYISRYNGNFYRYQVAMHKDLRKWRAEEDSEFAKGPILKVIRDIDRVPEPHRTPLKISLGGFMNQACVFACMSYNKYQEERLPRQELYDLIELYYMTYDSFKAAFTDAAMNVVGSGYVWLVRTSREPKAQLEIITTPNEESPLSSGLIPVLALDMWERAYYEQFSWNRELYIKNWWKLVDWDEAEDMAYFFSNDRLNPKSVKTQTKATKEPVKHDKQAKEQSKEEEDTKDSDSPQQTTPTQEL